MTAVPQHGRPDSDLASAEQDRQVIALKRQGLTFREIAAELKISKSQVHRSFHRALNRIPASEVQEYRNEQLQHIALAREVVLDVLASYTETVAVTKDGDVIPVGEDFGPVLTAVDRLVRLDDHEAKLLGLYAATKMQADVSVSYTVGGGVDPAVLS